MNVAVYTKTKPTRRQLDDFKDDFDAEIRKGFERTGHKIKLVAKVRAPVSSGALKDAVNLTLYKGGGLRVWFKKSVKNARGIPVWKYARPIHWSGTGGKGSDGYSGTKFLFGVVYPDIRAGQPNPKRAGGVAPFIVKDIRDAMDVAVDKFNRHVGVALGND